MFEASADFARFDEQAEEAHVERDRLAQIAGAAHHLVSIDRPIKSLQPQLPDVRGFHPSFEGTERPLTDHDLARICLVAEPRCKIDDAVVGGILATMFEANLAERCVARSDPKCEPKIVALSGPLLRQTLNLIAHIKREPDGTLGMIGTGDRIIENDHDALGEEPFQCAFMSEDEFSHALVIFPQDRHDIFGFGRLREGAESAQLAEQRRHLPPVVL